MFNNNEEIGIYMYSLWRTALIDLGKRYEFQDKIVTMTTEAPVQLNAADGQGLSL